MPIQGSYFAQKSKINIKELIENQSKSRESLKLEVGKILHQVYYASGLEDANKIIEELELTDLLGIQPVEKKDY